MAERLDTMNAIHNGINAPEWMWKMINERKKQGRSMLLHMVLMGHSRMMTTEGK